LQAKKNGQASTIKLLPRSFYNFCFVRSIGRERKIKTLSRDDGENKRKKERE
jgi:hypothetical protein